jgi:hypothetical protein
MSYSSTVIERLVLLVLAALLAGLMVSAKVPAGLSDRVYATDSGVMSDAVQDLSRLASKQ